MKKIILTLLLITTATLFGVSAPSFSIVKKQASKLKASKITWPGKGIVKKIGRYEWTYSRTARLTRPAGKGVTCSGLVSFNYKKTGTNGKWVFVKQSFVGANSCKGFKKPSPKELISVIKTNLAELVGYASYDEIVGDIKNLRISKNPKYKQTGPNNISANFEVNFSKKTSGTEITRFHKKIRVTFFRDASGSFSRFLSDEINSKKMGVKKFKSSKELDKIRTLADINMEREAAAIVDRLPKITVPKFKMGDKFIYYLHDKMLNADTLEMQAIIYKRFAPSFFVKNRKNVLLRREFNNMQKILKNKEAYKRMYCQIPKVKHKQSNMMQFFDKEGRKSARFAISFDEISKTWRILAIDFYVPSEDEIKTIEAFGNKNCDAKKTLFIELESFKVGDIVSYKFSNGLNYGKVIKLDIYNKNRYQIKFKNIKTIWGEARFMKKADTSKFVDNSNTKIGFNIGDRVEVKFSNGSYKGSIKEINKQDKKLLVDFDTMKDSWVYTEYTKKISGEKPAEKIFKVGDKVKVKFRTASYVGVVEKIDKNKKKLFVKFKEIQAIWASENFVELVK